MYRGRAAWAVPELVRIAQREGARALYKGYAPKLLRLGPGGGILNAVFQFVANKLRARRAPAPEQN